MVDELADLLGLHKDEALVVAFLIVLLLENDGQHPVALALLGCHVTPNITVGLR